MTVNLESQDVWKLILRGQETDKEQVRKGDNALAGLYEVYTPLWWTKFGTLVLRTWAQTKNFSLVLRTRDHLKFYPCKLW